MILQPGDEPIPGYKLTRFIGKGQFGQVWESGTPGRAAIALKFLDLSGKQGRKEFRAIQQMKRVRHAHLMPIIGLWLLDAEGHVLDDEVMGDIEEDSVRLTDTLNVQDTRDSADKPSVLIVGQPLGDCTLTDRLEECLKATGNGIPMDELLIYMEEAARVIDFLNTSQHDLGEAVSAIRHCDIKPTNILLMGNSCTITDYGLAQVLAGGQGSSKATGMLGSPAYMSPECIARTPSASSDQYSLAVSYVELRTGKLPFTSLDFAAVMDSHREGSLDLSGLLPPEQKVIRRATMVNPARRFPSAEAMVKALRETTLPEHADRQRERRRTLITLVVACLVCALAIGTAVWKGRNTQSQNDVDSRLESAESMLVEHPAAAVQLFDELISGTDGSRISPEHWLRLRLGRVCVRARVTEKEPGEIRQLLSEIEAFINEQPKSDSTIWPTPLLENTYLALRTIYLEFPDCLRSLFELRRHAGVLSRERSDAAFAAWLNDNVLPWEADKLATAEKNIYQRASSSDETVDERSELYKHATAIWPQIHNFSKLSRFRQSLDQARNDADVLAVVEEFTEHLENRTAWLSSADEAPRQLQMTYDALERRLAQGIVDESVGTTVRNFYVVLQNVVDATRDAGTADDRKALRLSLLRCAVVTYLFTADASHLERLATGDDEQVTSAFEQVPLLVAARYEQRTRHGATAELAPSRQAVIDTVRGLVETPATPFHSYLVGIYAHACLTDDRSSNDERKRVVKLWADIPDATVKFPVQRNQEFQKWLLWGFQHNAIRFAADSLYELPSGTAATSDDLALQIELARRECGDLLSAWSTATADANDLADQTLRDRWRAVELARQTLSRQHENATDEVDRDTIAAAVVLESEILARRGVDSMDGVSMFLQLVNPTFDGAYKLCKAQQTADHRSLLARAAYHRGNMIESWYVRIGEELEKGAGVTRNGEIERSFRYAFVVEPTVPEYLHQYCRAITEFPQDITDTESQRTRKQVDALRAALQKAPASSSVKTGWQGYVYLLESRYKCQNERKDQLDRAIACFDQVLSGSIAENSEQNGGEQLLDSKERNQRVSFLLNRSTARVELGFIEKSHQSPQELYESALADAREAVEQHGASRLATAHVAWGNAAEDLAYYVKISDRYDEALAHFERGLPDPQSRTDFYYPPAGYGWARCLLRQIEFKMESANELEKREMIERLSLAEQRLFEVIDDSGSFRRHKAEGHTWLGRTYKFRAEHSESPNQQKTDRDSAVQSFLNAFTAFEAEGDLPRQLSSLLDAWTCHFDQYKHALAGKETDIRKQLNERMLALLDVGVTRLTAACVDSLSIREAVVRQLYATDSPNASMDIPLRSKLLQEFNTLWNTPADKAEHRYLEMERVRHVFSSNATASRIADAVDAYDQFIKELEETQLSKTVQILAGVQRGNWLVSKAINAKKESNPAVVDALVRCAENDEMVLDLAEQCRGERTSLLDCDARFEDFRRLFLISVTQLWTADRDSAKRFVPMFKTTYEALSPASRDRLRAPSVSEILTSN